MYELTLANHPAQARHPFTKKPLWDDDGNHVPLFPKQRSVKLDGQVIALVSESGNIGFTAYKLPEAIIDDVVEFVKAEFVEPTHVSVPKLIETDDDEDEE